MQNDVTNYLILNFILKPGWEPWQREIQKWIMDNLPEYVKIRNCHKLRFPDDTTFWTDVWYAHIPEHAKLKTHNYMTSGPVVIIELMVPKEKAEEFIAYFLKKVGPTNANHAPVGTFGHYFGNGFENGRHFPDSVENAINENAAITTFKTEKNEIIAFLKRTYNQLRLTG